MKLLSFCFCLWCTEITFRTASGQEIQVDGSHNSILNEVAISDSPTEEAFLHDYEDLKKYTLTNDNRERISNFDIRSKAHEQTIVMPYVPSTSNIEREEEEAGRPDTVDRQKEAEEGINKNYNRDPSSNDKIKAEGQRIEEILLDKSFSELSDLANTSLDVSAHIILESSKDVNKLKKQAKNDLKQERKAIKKKTKELKKNLRRTEHKEKLQEINKVKMEKDEANQESMESEETNIVRYEDGKTTESKKIDGNKSYAQEVNEQNIGRAKDANSPNKNYLDANLFWINPSVEEVDVLENNEDLIQSTSFIKNYKIDENYIEENSYDNHKGENLTEEPEINIQFNEKVNVDSLKATDPIEVVELNPLASTKQFQGRIRAATYNNQFPDSSCPSLQEFNFCAIQPKCAKSCEKILRGETSPHACNRMCYARCECIEDYISFGSVCVPMETCEYLAATLSIKEKEDIVETILHQLPEEGPQARKINKTFEKLSRADKLSDVMKDLEKIKSLATSYNEKIIKKDNEKNNNSMK